MESNSCGNYCVSTEIGHLLSFQRGPADDDHHHGRYEEEPRMTDDLALYRALRRLVDCNV